MPHFVADPGISTHEPVSLARQPEFHVGRVEVLPSALELVCDGARIAVEPRVMQVLVCLAGARGAVVSRAELNMSCWGGRIVGDDAINHAIGKLRQLAERCGHAFTIETIPRVGHRLVERGAAPVGKGPERPPAPVATPGPPRRRTLLLAGLSAGALGLGALAAWTLRGQREPKSLADIYYDRGIATRGQGYGNQYEQAIGYFRKAVEADPTHGDAWGALAWSYRVVLATDPAMDEAALLPLARSAANRALELDPRQPDARLALLLLAPNLGRWQEVEQGARSILADHPGHSITLFQLGYILAQTGRWRESIRAMEEVRTREPTWPMASFRLFEGLSALGRVEEADAAITEAMRLSPRNGAFWSSQIDQLLLTGRLDAAEQLLDDRRQRPADDPMLVARQGRIVAAFRDPRPASRQAVVDALLADARADAGLTLDCALWLAMLNQPDAAFPLLEGFYLGRGPWGGRRDARAPTHPLFELAMAPLVPTQRFAALVEAIGLEAYWRNTGTRPDFRIITPG